MSEITRVDINQSNEQIQNQLDTVNVTAPEAAIFNLMDGLTEEIYSRLYPDPEEDPEAQNPEAKSEIKSALDQFVKDHIVRFQNSEPVRPNLYPENEEYRRILNNALFEVMSGEIVEACGIPSFDANEEVQTMTLYIVAVEKVF